MKREPSKKNLRIVLAGLWLAITFSVSAWWMIHGMSQASEATDPRLYRMFFWEGTFLLAFVLLGGAGLFWAIHADEKRNEEMRHFFATFTHELKTSLTSLRLQAEILEEDPRNRENENLRRLLRDVVRLELQLENALVLAQAEKSKLFFEEIPLRKTVTSMAAHWLEPEVKWSTEYDAKVLADQRALECILKNFFQNSAVHGRATKIYASVCNRESDGVEFELSDNGKGFGGKVAELGSKLVRHTTRSGSGVGLYLTRILVARMGGTVQFRSSPGVDPSRLPRTPDLYEEDLSSFFRASFQLKGRLAP